PSQVDHHLGSKVAAMSPDDHYGVGKPSGGAISAGFCSLRIIAPFVDLIQICKQVLLQVWWDDTFSARIKPICDILDVHLLTAIVVVEQQFLTGTVVMHAEVSLAVNDRTGCKQLPAIIVEEIVA